MLKVDRKNTKDITCQKVQDIQDTNTLKMMSPTLMPPEHVENFKMQLTVNINTNTGPDTSINQILRQNVEPPEGHIERGCHLGTMSRMKNAPNKGHPQTHTGSRGEKPMPAAGVMRQQCNVFGRFWSL